MNFTPITQSFLNIRQKYPAWVFLTAAALSGVLLIHAGRIFFDDDPTPSVLLFGSNFLSSAGVLLMVFAAIGTVTYWLERRGVDRFSLAIFAVAGLVSLHYLHVSCNNAYTNDWYQMGGGHFPYADFISKHPLNPYGFHGWEEHHPPVYYYFAGAMIVFAKTIETLPVLTMVRFLSCFFTLWFSAFGLLTLRRAGLPTAIYRACAVLFLLWPAGIHLASKISNEPMYYACYAAAFYYALVWYQDNKDNQLMRALLWAGVGFTVRTNAIVVFAVIAALVLAAWCRERFDFRRLYSEEWGLVALWLAIFLIINSGRIIIHSLDPGELAYHFGTGTSRHVPLSNFLIFNYKNFIISPFNTWSGAQTFWDYLLKTMLYGEYRWRNPDLARLLNLMECMIVLYITLTWLMLRRGEMQGKEMFPYVAAVLLPLAFHMIFMMWKSSMNNQDARYVYPMLPCFCVLYGRALVLLDERRSVLLPVGIGLAYSFAALSVIFFWGQVR